MQQPKFKLNALYQSILYCSLAIPAISHAQEAEEVIEEVVVTGSFIKREKFDMASPVETIDAVDIQTSGYTDVGPYIRDLTYTANVDTVANVLATGDGQQDSNSAMFNLRGLGTSSTLTLFDGRRVLNSGAVGSILPDIATKRVEVILDGGAATYGTDAVAGVVNLIPDKDYEGFKVRGFYTTDEEGDAPESKVAFKWGSSLNDQLHVVFSAEYSERTDALYRSDRPKYLGADNDSSISGNPGNFSSPTGANWGNDPECGTYNGTNTDDSQSGSYPSGGSAFGGFICTFEYGEYQDFKRPNQDFKTLLTAVYDVNSSLSFELIYSLDKYESLLISSPSTAERSSNDTLTITSAHPNWPTWPFAQTVPRTPRNWRPFTNNGATTPSFLDERGANNDLFYYKTEMISLGSQFELGDSGWDGSAWYTTASSEENIKGYELSRSRLRAALQGTGGPNGNQWFNPFGTSSPLSSNYVACETGTGPGCSANDQELVDWLYSPFDYRSRRTEYWSAEAVVTGSLFEMPGGDALIAIGGQYRESSFETGNSALQNVNDDYDTSIYPGSDSSRITTGENAVASAFFELDIPVLDNLGLIVAGRYEDFKDLDLSAFVPKVSARYQPTDFVALRASWGKGFLSPSLLQVTEESTLTCGELFNGDDLFLPSGSLIGTLSCFNGNSDIEPEDSELWNIGVTWQINDDWELNLDYQEIDYVDRIVTLGSSDVVALDYANFLEFTGLSEAQYAALRDSTLPADLTDAANRRAAWFSSGQNDLGITRDPLDESVTQVIRSPFNVASVNVSVVDFRLKYGAEIGNLGYFTANWSTTRYVDYDYINAFGNETGAEGSQSGNTDLVPPLPKMKHQLGLGWMNDGHRVGLTFKHQSAVEFDQTPGPSFGPEAFTGEAPEEIKAQTIVDLRYSYHFDDLFGSQFDLAVGSNNVLDKEPQALPIPGGLETRLQDPIGRTFYIEGTISFE